MSNKQTPTTYAFVLAYLLGVERQALEKTFFQDYLESEGLERFVINRNAETLRELTTLRNAFCLHYDKVQALSSISLIAHQVKVEQSMYYLETQDISLTALYRKSNSLIETINQLTNLINGLYLKVLKEFDIPYKEVVGELFIFPRFSNESIRSLVTRAASRKLPFNLFIPKLIKSKETGKCLFESDVNLFSAMLKAMSRVVPKQLDIPPFDWSLLEPAHQVKVPDIQNAVLYVDSDNADPITFYSMLLLAKHQGQSLENTQLIAFKDDTTNPLWCTITPLFPKELRVEWVHCTRIVDSKSLVDLRLTARLLIDRLTTPTTRQVLIASDSDYGAIMEQDIDLMVFGDNHLTSIQYLQFLKRKKQPYFDMSTCVTADIRLQIREHLFTYLCLEHLATIPMTQWTVEHLIEWFHATRFPSLEYVFKVIKGEVDSLLTDLVSNVDIQVRKGVKKLSYRGVIYETN